MNEQTLITKREEYVAQLEANQQQAAQASNNVQRLVGAIAAINELLDTASESEAEAEEVGK